ERRAAVQSPPAPAPITSASKRSLAGSRGVRDVTVQDRVAAAQTSAAIPVAVSSAANPKQIAAEIAARCSTKKWLSRSSGDAARAPATVTINGGTTAGTSVIAYSSAIAPTLP